MKKIITIMLAVACWTPAAATATQPCVTLVALSTDTSDSQPCVWPMCRDEQLKDEELTRISGQSLTGLLPWGGLVPETELVTRIKLWDEGDRVPRLEVLRTPGSMQSSTLPMPGAKTIGGL